MTVRPLTSRQRAARNHEMRDLRKLGWTYARIAEHYGVSRQRVHAIVADGKPAQPFYCEATHGDKSCLRSRGHKGAHRYGKRAIVKDGKP